MLIFNVQTTLSGNTTAGIGVNKIDKTFYCLALFFNPVEI